MSLIQQALKRKLEEEMGGGAATLPEPPPLPQSEHPKRSAWAKLFLVSAILLALGAGAIGLFLYAAQTWSTQTALEGGAMTSGAPPIKPVMPDPSSLKGKIDHAVSTIETAAAGQMQAINAMEGTPSPASQPAAAIATPPPAASPVVNVVQGPPAQPAVKPAPAPRRNGMWPIVTLNGILASSQKGRGAAVLNNRVINVSDNIDGVVLLEVQERGVILEFEGEKKFVQMGQTVQ